MVVVIRYSVSLNSMVTKLLLFQFSMCQKEFFAIILHLVLRRIFPLRK